MADEMPAPTKATATSGEEQAVAIAKDLVGKNAPWKKGIPWPVVMTQGGVLVAAGLLLFFAPSTGALALQILALVLLASAAVSVWRLLRGTVAPQRQAVVGFRAGVGITVGSLAIMGTLLAGGTDANRIALAVVLGTGFLLYGVASAISALAGRDKGMRFPVVALVTSVLGALLGVYLIVQANAGIDALKSTFANVGLAVAIAGGILCAYAFYLRSNPALPPEE
jgi:hypothetical protein